MREKTSYWDKLGFFHDQVGGTQSSVLIPWDCLTFGLFVYNYILFGSFLLRPCRIIGSYYVGSFPQQVFCNTTQIILHQEIASTFTFRDISVFLHLYILQRGYFFQCSWCLIEFKGTVISNTTQESSVNGQHSSSIPQNLLAWCLFKIS